MNDRSWPLADTQASKLVGSTLTTATDPQRSSGFSTISPQPVPLYTQKEKQGDYNNSQI